MNKNTVFLCKTWCTYGLVSLVLLPTARFFLVFTLTQVKSFSVQDFLRVPGRLLRLPQQAGGAVHETTQCHDSFPNQIVSHDVNSVPHIFLFYQKHDENYKSPSIILLGI